MVPNKYTFSTILLFSFPMKEDWLNFFKVTCLVIAACGQPQSFDDTLNERRTEQGSQMIMSRGKAPYPAPFQLVVLGTSW